MVLAKVTTRLLASLIAALAGACAVMIACGSPARPTLFENEFRWRPPAGGGVEEQKARAVTEARMLHLPQILGDFDLLATVELPDNGELDLVFRMVEPRPHEGSVESFHARFTLLRMSTRAEGPPYRTRSEALFADDLSGGVRLRAGQPASIRLEVRGRRARANVAGRWFPWLETTDDHGSVAFVARGGTTSISYLVIQPQKTPSAGAAWGWGALIAALAATLVLLGGAVPWRVTVACGVVVPLGGWLAHVVLFTHLLPWAAATTGGALLGGLWTLPVALALSCRFRWWAAAAAVLVAPVLLEFAARAERPRLAPLDDPRLTLYFGPDSGPAPFHALARRLRSRTRVHTLGEPSSRVMFLGGAAIFEASPDLGNQVGLLVEAALRRTVGRDVASIIVATPLANALQQLLMFRRFYLDYAPRVVVFGVTAMENATGQRLRAREMLDRAEDSESREGSVVLWALREGLVAGDQPVATAADLEKTLTELELLCRDRGISLVLATEPFTDPALVDVLQSFADMFSIPLVRNVIDETGAARIDELVSVVAERL